MRCQQSSLHCLHSVGLGTRVPGYSAFPSAKTNRKRQELLQGTHNRGKEKAPRARQGDGGYRILGSESRPQPRLTALPGSPSPPPGASHWTLAEELVRGSISGRSSGLVLRGPGFYIQFGHLIVLSTTVVKGLPLPEPQIPPSVKRGQ